MYNSKENIIKTMPIKKNYVKLKFSFESTVKCFIIIIIITFCFRHMVLITGTIQQHRSTKP